MGSFFRRRGKQQSGWMAIGMVADGVSAAHVRRGAGRPAVEWLAFYPSDRAARPEVLNRLEKDRGTDAYQCSCLLGLGEYQMLTLEAPAVPAEELKSAVRWRLKDLLDFHVDDATVDVLSVPSDKGATARAGSLFAVAAKNQLIGQLQNWFDEAGMTVRVIDIPEMAQRNIAALVEPEARAVAMLSVNADGALVTITHNGELYFTRRVDVTPAQLRNFNPDFVSPAHERITLELQRSLDHFDRHFHTIPLAKLVLAPMAEGAAELQAYLAANLHIPVETLDLDAVLDMARVPELKSREAQQRYFMVIGAALRHEEKAP